MGLLLKEALKTLCAGPNRWSYAVFWKIGCQNPKLLIWEDFHCESTSYSVPPHASGIKSPNLAFEGWDGCWVHSEMDRVHSLINKMILNNQVNVVGEGIVGRAAFTGNHQWILADNYIGDSHPPEVLSEVHQQFSAGIQTVAVIPVLPHGVIQLGSSLAILENTGFVNDVKSLILRLGCVPGALLSENYAAKEFAENVMGAFSLGTPVSIYPSENHELANLGRSLTDSHSQQSKLSQPRLVGQPSYSLIRHNQDNPEPTTSTFQTSNSTQTSAKSHKGPQPMVTSVMQPSLLSRVQLQNGIVGAEVIPSNPDAWLNQRASSFDSRFTFNHQIVGGQMDPSHGSQRLTEQHNLANAPGIQDHANNSVKAPSSFITSQWRPNGGLVPNSQKGSVTSSLLGGQKFHGETAIHSKPISVPCSLSSLHSPIDMNSSCTQLAVFGSQNADSCKSEVVNLLSLTDRLNNSCMLSRGTDHWHHSTDVTHNHSDLAPRKHKLENDFSQALKMPLTCPDENVSLSAHIPGYLHETQRHGSESRNPRSQNVIYEDACAQPPSGDDLFDVLGADFKNKLLSASWNNVLDNGLDVNGQNLGGDTPTSMNFPEGGSDFYSVSGGISDSGMFSGTGADHLLDAVVSRANSAGKQSSDDNVSCRTVSSKISSSSAPSSSPTYGRVGMSELAQRELFGLPNILEKTGTIGGSSTFGSGCSKDDAASCSQTNSIYGSQIKSWVEQHHNLKHESNASTAYSKRPDESSKSNRKRLKPGENPRPRPKDRQMIQDRVKELREIVPNGAKCSIDALLERTIKHMLFLQSVTKHADKLKQTGESKIINKEGGLLLKDNYEGGATWAFEVGSQSMVCPIIVEDLNSPRQMLVEMLCEERGFFLEIADLIRGLGLTILKGVMEARNDKIWARFTVEANRDVTRMEIFLSLVRLLEQTVKGSTSSANAIESNNMIIHHPYPHAAPIPATGRPSSLQ